MVYNHLFISLLKACLVQLDGTGSASTAGMDVVTTKDSYIPQFSGRPSDYKEWRKRLNDLFAEDAHGEA